MKRNNTPQQTNLLPPPNATQIDGTSRSRKQKIEWEIKIGPNLFILLTAANNGKWKEKSKKNRTSEEKEEEDDDEVQVN